MFNTKWSFSISRVLTRTWNYSRNNPNKMSSIKSTNIQVILRNKGGPPVYFCSRNKNSMLFLTQKRTSYIHSIEGCNYYKCLQYYKDRLIIGPIFDRKKGETNFSKVNSRRLVRRHTCMYILYKQCCENILNGN